MRKTICCTLAVAMMMGCMTGCGGDSKKSGASSEEKAVENFMSTFLDADIDGMLSASAPEEFWDFYSDMSGLTNERFVYQLAGVEDGDEFHSEIDEWNQYLDDEGIKIKDIEIKEMDEVDNELFSYVSLAMQNAGVDGKVEEVYWMDTDYDISGLLYLIGGKWYFGTEWLLEDALEMTYGE